MLVGLLTLFSAIFGLSEESPYAIPYAEENIISAIEDDARKKEAKALFKGFDKNFKSIQAIEKKRHKEMEELNADYKTTAEDTKLLFNAAKEERMTFSDKLISGRIKIQALLTTKEWEVLTRSISLKIEEKEWKTSEKELEKSIKTNKLIKTAKEEIVAAFKDGDKQQKATIYFEAFEKSLIAHFHAHQNYLQQMLYLAKDQNASKKDIAELIDMNEKFRSDLGLSFIEMRANLVKLSTEAQWSTVANTLSKFIK